MSDPSQIHEPQINYKPVHQENSMYKFLRVGPSNQSSPNFTVTALGSVPAEFRIPPNLVWNPAQSYFGYQTVIPAQGAGVYAYTTEDTLEVVTNLTFGTIGTPDIVNLAYPNRHVKINRRLGTSIDEFLSNDNTSQLYPSNGIASANLHPSAVGTQNYIESNYANVSAANTAMTSNRMFPFSGLKDTFLAMDKNVYLPVDSYLRMTLGPANQFAWSGTSNTAPGTGAADLTGNILIQNCYLYICVEKNQLIADSVKNKVLTGEGLTLLCPSTTAFKNPTTSAVGAIQIQLHRGYGTKLKYITHTVFSAVERLNTCLDHANGNGNKVQTYVTYLDGNQLQDQIINTAAIISTSTEPVQGDWKENKIFCLGTPILNRTIYGINWFHRDAFYFKNKKTPIPQDNLDDGLEMGNAPRTWAIQATMNIGTFTNWTHYTFATFNRQLVINKEGAIFIQ